MPLKFHKDKPLIGWPLGAGWVKCPMPKIPAPKPVVLCILDGWGYREERDFNAVALANTPNFDRLWASAPHALLQTSGHAVGLPDGQMGNSEVGHLTLGTGRALFQDLPRIDQAITGGLDKLATLQAYIGKLKETQARTGRAPTVHLMGLISPGGIHSHQSQAAAFANEIAKAGFPVAIHLFLDGRDRPPQAAAQDLVAFQRLLQADLPIRIVTMIGRYFAMDRDKRWERVEQAYNLIVDGAGERTGSIAAQLASNYAANTTDEFAPAAVLGDYAGVADGDALLCINFRADRVRQILAALVGPDRLPDFKGFTRARTINWSVIAGMTHYSDELAPALDVLFPQQKIENDFGAVVAAHGLTQLRIAETEKYAHVTYFFSAGVEAVLPGERREMIPSPKVATYDLKPEMSAAEVSATAVRIINDETPDVVILNFANPDMVGHTGDLQAAIKAVEAVDAGMGALVDAATAKGGSVIIIADHGNCEEMWDAKANMPHTQHTLNPVPVILAGAPTTVTGLTNGTLADIAPTMLTLLGIAVPPEMTGRSLLQTA